MVKHRLGNGLAYGLTGLFAGAFIAVNLAGIITLIVFLFSPFAFADDSLAKNAQANAQCLSCHSKPGFSITKNGQKIDLFVDSAKYQQSIHATRACISCHGNLGGIPHKNVVYGKELASQVNKNCMACHDDVAKAYKNSIHGQLVLAGKDGATCADCHGVHDIKKTTNPAAMSYRLNVSNTCMNCHKGNVQTSYKYSFHGTSVSLGYQKGATCADCHGTHQILGPKDPKSTVSKQNVPQTCAKCHLQAKANFAIGNEHRVPQDKTNALPLWVIWKIFMALVLFDVTKDGSIAIFELIKRIRKAGKSKHLSD